MRREQAEQVLLASAAPVIMTATLMQLHDYSLDWLCQRGVTLSSLAMGQKKAPP
jgi:hypothetical protein